MQVATPRNGSTPALITPTSAAPKGGLKFAKATKKAARLRMGLLGPAGSGKTYTALAIATALGQRVAVIDTEHGSASKYADLFAFDALELDTFSPTTYVEAIHAAEAEGYDVIVIDSLSHAWMGKDGALEQVDRAAKRNGGGNSFAGWRDVTPMHNAMVEAMLQCKAHLLVTVRQKMEYVLEENDRGKKVPRKIGLQPVQRDGLEFEFDVVGDLNQDNELTITKTRCSALQGAFIKHPGRELAERLRLWLTDGSEMRVEELSVPTLKTKLAELLGQVVDAEKKSAVLSWAGDDRKKLLQGIDKAKRDLAAKGAARSAPASPEPTPERGDAAEP